jgi:DNA-binding GntR family transcriptional regulator
MLRHARHVSGTEDDGTAVVRKSERAYSWLREEILSFRMQPGMFIDKVEVCEKLGVSKQPVTAALTRLEQEGLVEIYPQRGSYVARLRLGAMTESLFIRGALEAAAMRRLAEDGNDLLTHTLKKTLDSQEAALAAENPGRYYTLDQDFHFAIAKALPFPQVAHQIDIGLATVKRCHELFRPDVKSIRGSYEGHRRIVAALEARDGEVASQEMTRHVSEYAAMLRAFAEARPELFVG